MEVTNNRQMTQVPVGQQEANNAGKAEPKARQEMPPIAIKAAPKVPEFKAKDLDKAIEDLRAFIEGLGRNLSFRQDESIDRSVITVRDESTNQIVRQIPSEEVVAMARQLREQSMEFRAGLLMDKQV